MAQAAAPAQSPSDPEKHQDRIITLRTALLSSGVVILAGLIGAGSSYIVANRQIASQESQSQVEFLRAERQKQYAAFVGQFDQLSDAVSEYFPGEENPGRTFESLNSMVDRLTAVIDEMEGIEDSIVLLGSEEAKGRAEEVAVASRGMNDVIFTCSRIYATTDYPRKKKHLVMTARESSGNSSRRPQTSSIKRESTLVQLNEI
jgi:hypothetical protein